MENIEHAQTDQAAPERLWMGDIDSECEPAIWLDPDEGGTEYVRADLAAPSAPAEVEGLVRWKFNRVSGVAKEDSDGGWVHYEDAATALTSLQAENERLIAEVETLQGAQIVNRNAIRMQREAREKAEAENERLRDLLNISTANLEDATARAEKAEAERAALRSHIAKLEAYALDMDRRLMRKGNPKWIPLHTDEVIQEIAEFDYAKLKGDV